MEQLRTQARDALLQGARSGRLLEAPEPRAPRGVLHSATLGGNQKTQTDCPSRLAK